MTKTQPDLLEQRPAADPAAVAPKKRTKKFDMPTKQQAVAVAEKQTPPPAVLPTMMRGLPATDAAAGLIGLIERLAQNPNVDIERMTALLDMQERIMDKMARAAFTRDFSAMSQELPRIVKTGSVGYKEDKNDKNSAVIEAFKFAKFEDIDEVVRPILHKFGFAIHFVSENRDGGGLTIVGTLSHCDGHEKVCRLPLALDTSGGKNNLQGMGSTTSYGIRYAHKILLNLVFVGEDNDGLGDPPEPITNEQAVELDNALRAKEATISEEKRPTLRPRFLAYMGVASIPEITDYATAKNAIAAIGAPNKATTKTQQGK